MVRATTRALALRLPTEKAHGAEREQQPLTSGLSLGAFGTVEPQRERVEDLVGCPGEMPRSRRT